MLAASAETTTPCAGAARPPAACPPAIRARIICTSGALACFRTTNSVRVPVSFVSILANRALTFSRLSLLAVTIRALEFGSATMKTISSGLMRWPRWAWKACARVGARAAALACRTGMMVLSAWPRGAVASSWAASSRIFWKVASSARTMIMRASRWASMTTPACPGRRAAPKTFWSTWATPVGSAWAKGISRTGCCPPAGTSICWTSRAIRSCSRWGARMTRELLPRSAPMRTPDAAGGPPRAAASVSLRTRATVPASVCWIL